MLTRIFGERREIDPGALVRQARLRVRRARGEGVERLWLMQADALERVEDALQKAQDRVPVLSRVAEVAERAVHQRLETVTAAPLAGYDELNAKQVRSALRDLGRFDLVRLRRYETTHKNRKSVLNDIDRELARLDRLEAELSPTEPAEA